MPAGTKRRAIFGILAAATAVATLAASPATADDRAHTHPGQDKRSFELTVMGTTDTHGHVFNWDYFKDKAYSDKAGNNVGLAKISTLVNQVRAERGRDHTLLIDAGDTIQGTPLAYYYAKVDPITNGTEHPMAAAMNAMGYDAAALGNHEFNYGIPVLRAFQHQLNFPLLGANAIDDATGKPAFPPYVIKTVKVKDGPAIKVGILGLTNPGIAIWDRANVSGKMHFPGLVEQAKVYVPLLHKLGADVVVVSAHSGMDTSSSYGDALPYPENAASLVAQQVPGIDAILVGHAHQEIAQRIVTNEQTGKPVVLTEPSLWGERLALIDLKLQRTGNHWKVRNASSSLLNSNTAAEDPTIVKALQGDHETVVKYVNSTIGEAKATMSGATSRYEDTALLDYVNKVQGEAVKKALAGTADAALPVLSIAAPFSRDAVIPQGPVSIRDIAGVYVFDNTLLASKLNGQQVKDYLEFSAQYFNGVAAGTTTVAANDITNAKTALAPSGTPDYNYDVIGGVDAPLTYDIDLSKPVGQRIVNLAYNGVPVTADQEFAVAVNNYRQSGGGNFPAIASAPVLMNQQQEIRQLMIDDLTVHGTIDPSTFASKDWRLTSGSQELTVTP